MPFAEGGDMVAALATDRSDQPFGEAVLPRRTWGTNLFILSAREGGASRAGRWTHRRSGGGRGRRFRLCDWAAAELWGRLRQHPVRRSWRLESLLRH